MSILHYYNIVWNYNISYVLYMANSQGRVSLCLYYNITICVKLQYNVVLYMANSQGRVSVCLYYNITILCGNTI